MIEVKDEIISGEPYYRITDNRGNTLYDGIKIELITPVTQPGTPINKVLFDSIKEDINKRLLIQDKATSGEAIAGTNNTKYITPLTLKAGLDTKSSRQIITSGATSPQTINTSTFSKYDKVIIELNSYYDTEIELAGDIEIMRGIALREGNVDYLYSGSTENLYLIDEVPTIDNDSAFFEDYRVRGEIEIDLEHNYLKSDVMINLNRDDKTGRYIEMVTFENLTSIKLPSGDWTMYGILYFE